MKTCRRCGALKPLDEYYSHPQMADGHLNICKECTRHRVEHHRWRSENLERIREYDRRRGRSRTPEVRAAHAVARDPEAKRRASRGWSRRNRLKRLAYAKVYQAIRDERLTPQPCEVCGVVPAEAHHDDYSKPLDVRWLCKKHHDEHHVRVRDERRAAFLARYSDAHCALR